MSSKKLHRQSPISRQSIFFGGTSITALIKRPILDQPITKEGYDFLADQIARSYVEETKALEPYLKKGFTKSECGLFAEHGIFYGIHISPKLLALCEGLIVEHKELLLPGFPEPYQLPKQPPEIISAYFRELKLQRGLDLALSSLVLADTTTPCGYEGKKILNPTNINEKLVDLSTRVTARIKGLHCSVDPLYLVCTDTDSPHRILLSEGRKILDWYPLTPGVTLCGSTASMEGFDFRYLYRIGLIAQQLGGNIISSRIREEYAPFIMVGMLSPFGYQNGAIPVGKMGDLRYPGNIDLKKEFFYLYERDINTLLG